MPDVTIDTKRWCGDGTRAKGRLQIFIGATHVGGCDDLHQREAEGRLDALLA